MKMKIAALFLVVLLPVLAVTATYASKPASGNGTVALVSSHRVGSSRIAGGNNITTVINTFVLTGPLTGRAVALERDVIHSSSERFLITFQGVANFTKSTGGTATSTSMLVIRYVGINNGTFIHGQFVAGDGTGSLANFHGQGQFSGQVGPTPLNYTINWHINPADVKTKTAA